ncbi:MAG TPA: hypothetical protein PK566_11660 [Pseudobacteroides sp.]|nr:hypothetical protein [Pseudobacteroides sp.]
MAAIVIFVIIDIIVVAVVLSLLFKFLDIRVLDKFRESINKNPKLKAGLEKAVVFIKDIDIKNKISNIKLPKIELPKKSAKEKPSSTINHDVKQDIANYFKKKNERATIGLDTYEHPKFGRIGVNDEPVREDNQNSYIQNNNVVMNQRLVPAESTSYSGSFSVETSHNQDDSVNQSAFRFTPWAGASSFDSDNSQEMLDRNMFDQNKFVDRAYGETLNQDRSREAEQNKSYNNNLIINKEKKEKVKKEKVKKEKSLFGGSKNKIKNKKYKIVQTGFASIFFGRNNNIIIIPYAKDIEGKGRAMDNIVYFDGPIPPHQLGEAIRQTIEVDKDVYPFTDKELIKELQVKEWSEFTQGKRYISVRYDEECGYILNTTTRNPDGSYRLNCPGGIEKIVNKDATLTDLGDTVYHLLEKCRA